MDVKVSSWNHRFPSIPSNTEWLSAKVWLWVRSDNVRSLALSWPLSLLIDSLISQQPFQISLTIYNWIMITVQSQVLPVLLFQTFFLLTGEEERWSFVCVCVCVCVCVSIYIYIYIPTWKNTIVIYSKYYSVFEPYYSKVYYTVYSILFTTIC